MGTATVLQRSMGTVRSAHVKQGEQVVVRVDPPLDGNEHLFVSESTVMGRPETYAFAWSEAGGVDDWLHLDISQEGFLSWRRVLRDAGYDVAEAEEGDGE